MNETTKHQVLLAAAVASAALLVATPRAEAQQSGPISGEWKAAFEGVRADPRPEKLTRDSHYWVSDEKRHDLFREAISDTGGIFVGLGPDQNYLMAGWARPEILVPLDFDQMIVNLHYAFRVLFLAAETPEEFVDMWSFERYEELRTRIAEEYKDRDKKWRRGVQRAFKVARRLVYARLKLIMKSYRKRGVSTFLDDPEQYRFVRGLFQEGRVFPVRGDLTADRTLVDLAAAADKTGLKIRTLYLSNAEQYFKYVQGSYRANMLALPFDEKSVVIRTAGTGKKSTADGRYEYVVQSGSNFRAWMEHPKTYSVWTIVGARTVNRKTGTAVVERLPGERRKKRKSKRVKGGE